MYMPGPLSGCRENYGNLEICPDCGKPNCPTCMLMDDIQYQLQPEE